jgi:hypothetical protein
MCAACNAAQARKVAAGALLAACEGAYGLRPALQRTFPPLPLPADMLALLGKLGGTKQ